MEAVDTELDRLISRRASQDRRQDPDELEPSYAESVRRYHSRRRKEMRAEWYGYHLDQAERLRFTLGRLIEHHETQAMNLLEGNDQ